MQVLLAGSDRALLADLESLLRRQGYNVRMAGDALEACESIRTQRISLLICSWHVPGMTGTELCRTLRATQPPHYVYVILYAGQQDKHLLLAGLDAGADDFLLQPIDPAELLARLRAGERVLKRERKLEIGNFSLDWVHEQLAESHETMRKDVARAAAIQKSLLPEPNAWPLCTVDWLFMPSYFLAGDMLGYFPVQDNCLAFFLFDVCGHGISSALISFATTKLLRQDWDGEKISVLCDLDGQARKAEFPAPNQVIEALNRRYCKDPESKNFFLTLIYGVFDACTGQTRISAAGHPPPLLWRRSERVFIESTARGLPVGIIEDTEYEEEILLLEPGDRLFVFSDGIIECPSPTGELYGDERFRETLSATAHLPVAAVKKQISANLKAWHGSESFPDDVSLLILER